MTIQSIEAGTEHAKARGFQPDSIKAYERSGVYRDCSVTWVCPLRDQWVPLRTVGSWLTLKWPPNQGRSGLIPMAGMEVGESYNKLFEYATDYEAAKAQFGPRVAAEVSAPKFVFTTEYDNVLPPNALLKLLETIHLCPDCDMPLDGETWTCSDGHHGYAAVSGLYNAKDEIAAPMVYGDPKIDPEDFKPRLVSEAMEKGLTIEVNGIPMGCGLFRKDIFKKMTQPWFKTTLYNTQDIWFCKKARQELGPVARFGVNCAVLVGHLEPTTGELF